MPPGSLQQLDEYSQDEQRSASSDRARSQARPLLLPPPLPPAPHAPPVQRYKGNTMQPQYTPPLVNGGQVQQYSAPYPPPAPPPPLHQQYHPNGGDPNQTHGMAPGQAMGQNGMIRYAIPPQAPLPAGMDGVRKVGKEIKRRTKSGCMTCRKRRIKCDEGQPACRNCLKSKRECLGYDPIFRPQPPVPAHIQPAPTASAPSNSSTTSTPYQRHSDPRSSTYEPHFHPHQQHHPSLDPALQAGRPYPSEQSTYATTMLPARQCEY